MSEPSKNLDKGISIQDDAFDLSQTTVKKPKKVVAFEDENQEETAVPTEEHDDNMFSGLKKKKKKVPTTAERESEPIEDTPEEMDFSATLKKKKKKKTVDLDAFDQQLREAGVGASTEDTDTVATTEPAEDEDDDEPWLKSDREYTYSDLLKRFFKTLRQNNPELAGDRKRHRVVPPVVHRDGKKSIFANIADICKQLNRKPDHLIEYMFAELGTSGSVDGSERLIIKGKYQGKQIENILRKYITEYVSCKTCRSLDTELSKENRIVFIKCNNCQSSRSVSAIKTGFQAQTTKRKLMKPAQ